MAFLVFQSLRKGSYLHDAEISMVSGRLREAGVDNDVVEVVFHGSNEAENEALIGRLADRIVARGYDLLVFHRIWDSEIPVRLRAALEAAGSAVAFVFHPAKIDAEASDVYDFVVRGLSYETFLQLARTGEVGADVIEPDDSIERWKQPSNFQRVRINPEAKGHPPAVVIYGNPGCPFRRAVDEVPFWQGLDLDPETTSIRGCSFCDVNLAEDYRFVKGIATDCVRQITKAQEDVPDAVDMVLLDQDPFPFLPALFEGLAEVGAPPIHLLIQARADLFEKRFDQFERALERARAGGHRCSPFLVGIENFHQPTLDIYNKGVTVETNASVLAYLEGVSQRFGDVLDRDRISPGFILWHPWVSFESLRVNLAAITDHGLIRFRSEVALSKIRFYPDIPFYWKAKNDGLLLDRYGAEGLSSAARYGYPEEHPYRFARPESQAAYTVLAALCHRYEPIHEMKLLRLVLDWVESQRDLWDDDQRLGLHEPDAVIERFLADHEEAVQGLRKQNTSARDLTDADRARIRALLFDGEGDVIGPFELARMLGDGDRVQLIFARRGEAAAARHDPQGALFRLILEPRSDAAHYMQSAGWNISYSAPRQSPTLLRGIQLVCGLIRERDC